MTSRIIRAVPLGHIRLSEVEDAPKIMQLVTESMSLNFRVDGPADIVNLIENSVLSICQLDINETIVGFLAAKDYPLTPSIWPGAWEDFVWNKYKAVDLKARNTLFLHMLCWNPSYSRDAVDSMLKSMFMHDPYLHYIAMSKSLVNNQLLCPGQFRAEGSFKRFQALERGMAGDQLPSLWVADRKEVSPRLRIRRAVEEDNDDIVPIIERHSKRLRELYGDFYISELISRHPESERVLLVCEHKEVAVGVMCLNTQINYEALEENYELSPFAGLKHLDSAPQSHYKEMDSSMSFFAGSNLLESQYSSNIEMKSGKEIKPRVTWIFDEDHFKDIHRDVDNLAADRGPSQLDILSLLEEEEDELQFDIVNIDTDLLRLPKLFANGDATKKNVPSEKPILIKEDSLLEQKTLLRDYRKKKPRSISSATQITFPEPTRYSGTPNAFLLELFAMHPDYDERYGFDMLEAAFELFPDRDYCILCLPSSHTCFPLLEHFTLATPFGCRLRYIKESLYVAHVNSIKGAVKVRPGEACDTEALIQVLENAPRQQDLLNLFYSSLDSKILSSYVLLSQNQPIGLVILGPLEDAISIRNQYDLEPEMRKPNSDAAILAGVMSPVMEPHARWYLRELIRQSKYSTLFWICRLYTKGDASPGKNLMSLASHMIPVRPRRYMPNVIGNKVLGNIFRDVATPFALWSIERPMTSLPKVPINTSIVVVGASRTGLAFLETLLLGPSAAYLTFTNVTLVSECGLSAADNLRAADTCVLRSARFTDRYIKSIPFYYYIDVMTAVMVKIDRKKKCIHFQAGGVKHYDDLVLTCGRQFQHPFYLKESLEVAREIEKGKPCDRILMDNPSYKPDQVPPSPDLPDNVFLINSHYEANRSLSKLLWMMKDEIGLSQANPIVVYGDFVEAYCCIAALIELGVEPEQIAFVEPFPSNEATALRVNCFNNDTVDERVRDKLKHLGVTMYVHCHLVDWAVSDCRVEYLWLMTSMHMQEVPCFALFYYGLKAIDLNTYKAINESGLVYDDGLVVGAMFETNDPHVFAAGACTRYSRRLQTRVHQRDYCSEDVGETLAMIFLHRLDPFLTGTDTDSASDIIHRYSSSLMGFRESHGSVNSNNRINHNRGRWESVMKFESPIVVSATLPGPLYYLNVRRPGPDVPMAVQLLLPHQGHTLITDKNGNYFRLQLNALHQIESLCCLSNQPFIHETLAQTYGKHEAFFNNLLLRFQKNLIEDLFEYFTRPWIAALYQEPINNLLIDIEMQGGQTLYDIVKSKYMEILEDSKHETDDGTKTPGVIHTKICGQCKVLRHKASTFWKAIGGEQIVIRNLTKYLQKNSVCNPHYAIPDPAFI